MMRWWRPRRDERGTSALELTLIAPLLMVVLVFVVGLGRMAHARQQIEAVAADSARAASLERNTSQSAHAAELAATQSLGQAGVSCTHLDVDVDLSSYQPGGRVTVTVTYVDPTDVAVIGRFLGPSTHRATATMALEPE